MAIAFELVPNVIAGMDGVALASLVFGVATTSIPS